MSHELAPEDAAPTPDENAAQVRRLLHDINNGLEIVVQASYLLGTLDLPEDGKHWTKLLDQGVEQVTRLNSQLRELLIKQYLP